ncbi:MAG: class I SAM-dependent methyltransferase [Candidatus Atribacteria bacterium]|nr:class I SAM-dependent methyltransferase [Candidatus Atribacteria bacterium]
MKYLGWLRDLIQKLRIFKRYILNVRKLPLKMPMFISTLTEAQNDVISKYGNEFDIKTKSYSLSGYHRALYIMTRILKPEIVIETGVFEGHSSLSILLALEGNSKGHLYSIDLPSPKLPPGKEPGWFIPEHLRKKWYLRLGMSSDLLPALLKKVKEVDIFLHDSEHSYENMYWEYKTAWKYLRKGGLLLSHDISQNAAFRDFARYGSEDYYYMLRNLGGIKRTK